MCVFGTAAAAAAAAAAATSTAAAAAAAGSGRSVGVCVVHTRTGEIEALRQNSGSNMFLFS